MRKLANFLTKSFLSAVLLIATGESVLAAETGSAPVSGIENLLRGTKYEQLLAEQKGKPIAIPDKGFLPNLGNWANNDSLGWGLDIQALGNVLFAVWFTYNLDGTPTWYIIVGELTAKGGGMSMTGNVESFKWDPFGTPGDQATVTIVGTMTIEFTDASNANASWTLDGTDNAAPISFIRFAPPPTPANLTGHYFDEIRPGWGFTLLTQGDVTVMTMYWYKNGQPVWGQGVATSPGTSLTLTLLYFTGVGLCPSCLDDNKGISADPPTTEPLANMLIAWGLDDPPVVGVGGTAVAGANKGGPLGADPFSDIVFPVTTEAITSAVDFDPEYTEFIDFINGISGSKGPKCLGFQYDTGAFGGDLSGTMRTAYFLLVPDDDFFPVFTEVSCTSPFLFNQDFETFVPSGLMLAFTGEEGAHAKWSAKFFFEDEAKGEADPNSEEEGLLFVYGLLNLGAFPDKGPEIDARWYGVTSFLQIEVESGKFYIPLDVAQPPTIEQAMENPNDSFMQFIYP